MGDGLQTMAAPGVPARYDPVWFSTFEQVSAVIRAYGRASLTSKLLGRYDVPPGAAHVRGLASPWSRIPLAFVAQGRLVIGDRSLSFAPRPYRAFGWRVRNQLDSVAFELQPGDVSVVEPTDLHSPVGAWFNIPFTRIRTSRPAPLCDFLLCAGGRISPPALRRHSLDLRRGLLGFRASA